MLFLNFATHSVCKVSNMHDMDTISYGRNVMIFLGLSLNLLLLKQSLGRMPIEDRAPKHYH